MFVSLPAERHWLDALNDEQRRAATHAGGPLLVLAGAGTGKTTTLCGRAAWLIERGVAPERILLLTFTRRAAREMLQRTRALVARQTPRAVVGGTFHSVAYRTIVREASSFGLGDGVTLLDASDGADLMDLLREELGLATNERRFPRKATLYDIYSRSVNAQRELSAVLGESFSWCADFADEIAALYRAYTARKRALHALDLDDLLLYWRAAALEPRMGPRLAAQYEHLLVDEYQDVSALQVEIIQALRSERRDVTVVGDDMQAIYGFRAASPEHILEFPQRFDGTTVVKLERNYRSTQTLLDVGNEVAGQAERSFRRRLRADRAGSERPRLVFCTDEQRQAREVCDRVLDARERGLQLRDQAVLMRAGHHSDVLELELARRKIPFVKYGGIRYLEAAHVKDFVALVRIAVNPAEELSWFRVLQLLDGVGPVLARRLLARLLADPKPDAASLRARWDALELVPAAARDAGASLLGALARCAGETAAVHAERLRDALAPLVRARYPDGDVRLVDLDQLVGAAASATTLAQFVADLLLDPPLSSADFAARPTLDEDYLVLSTIHSAKGLEWESVHLIHASDGNIPSDMALTSKEGLEEELRLLYVAVTRPRRTLHVYVPLRYYHRPRGRDDAHGYGKPSRFLTDAVRQRCDVERCEHEPTLAGPTAGAGVKVEVTLDHLWR